MNDKKGFATMNIKTLFAFLVAVGVSCATVYAAPGGGQPGGDQPGGGQPGGDQPGREHMKGIYPAAKGGEIVALVDGALSRTIGLVCGGASRIVVWNCGKDPMRGYAKGEWRRFLCVEPANNMAEDAIRLAPGESHAMRFSVTVKEGGST